MPKLLIRLSYTDLHGGELTEKKPADVLNERFLQFEVHSAKETVIRTIAEYNHTFARDDPKSFKQFLERHNRDCFRSEYARMRKQYDQFTIFTRANLLFILRRLISDDSEEIFGKVHVSNINQMSHFLLKLTCFDDGAKDLTKDHDMENQETVLQLLTAIFRTNLINQKAQLSLSDLVRNYQLIERLLGKDEGRKAAEMFEKKYGLSATDFIELAFLIYVFLNHRYSEDNFRNMLNLDTDGFKSLPETFYKLKKFLDMMSDSGCYQFSEHESLYDFTRIWNAPVLKISDHSYQMLDLGFLVEKTMRYPFLFFESPYLNNPELVASKANLALRSKALGSAFQEQAEDLFSQIESYSLPVEDKNGDEIADFLFFDKDSLVLVEAKSGYIPIHRIISEIDAETVIQLLKKVGLEYPGQAEYQRLPQEQKKGLLQLVQTYFRISEEEYSSSLPEPIADSLARTENVFGVILVQELAFSISFLNFYLYLRNRRWLSELDRKGKRFHIPFIIEANDLIKLRNGSLPFIPVIALYTNHLENGGVLSFRDFIDENYGFPPEISKQEYKHFFNEKINNKYLSSSQERT